MNVRNKAVVYSRNMIQAWKDELESFPACMMAVRQAIATLEEKLHISQQLLARRQQEELPSIDQSISVLAAKVSLLTLPEKIKGLQEKLVPYQLKSLTLTSQQAFHQSQQDAVQQSVTKYQHIISYERARQAIPGIVENLTRLNQSLLDFDEKNKANSQADGRVPTEGLQATQLEISRQEEVLLELNNDVLLYEPTIRSHTYSPDIDALQQCLDEATHENELLLTGCVSIQNEINLHQSKQKNIESLLARHKHELEQAKSLVTDEVEGDLGKVNALLAAQQSLRKEKNIEIAGLKKNNDTINDEVQSQVRVLKQLEGMRDRLNECDFLNDVVYQPALLVAQLKTLLDSAVSDYEYQHPAQQSDLLRACLFDLPRQIAWIGNQANVTSDTYFQLVGLACHTVTRLAPEGGKFANTLAAIVDQSQIDKAEAAQLFMTLAQEDQYNLADSDLSHVELTEANRYRLAVEDFEGQLGGLGESQLSDERQLYKRGLYLLKTIRAVEKSADKTSDEYFDSKFYAKVLNGASSMIRQPLNLDLQENLASIASHNISGKASPARRAAGALQMLLGAAVILASVLMGVSIFGLFTPLTYAGVALGGAMMAIGCAACIHARQKGVDKALQGYQQASFFSSSRQSVQIEESRQQYQVESTLLIH